MCKFLQNEVQFPVGFLARPVTADHTHHNSGNDEHADDDDRSLDHAKVPCMLASLSATAMAETNMPAMIQTMSI